MEILLSKLAAHFIMPLFVGLGAQGLGLLAWRLGRRRSAATALACGWLVILVPAIPVVARTLRMHVERVYLPQPIDEMEEATAILLLGGSIGPALPPRLSVDLGPGADRVLHAARLHRAGKAPLVITSGGVLPWRESGNEGALSMASLLEEWGVPREAIVIESASRNTYENCARTKEIVDRRQLGRILLVTSALHMRRALATCRSAGLDALPAPTDYGIVDQRGDQPLRWLPDSMALENSTQAIRELVGFEVYRLRGWIDAQGGGE